MKQCFGTILLNALKIWGASWIGGLVSIIPLYIMRGNGAPTPVQNWGSALIGGLTAAVALFIFFVREGRSGEFRKYAKKELLLLSVLPSLFWIVVGCLFVKNNFVILVNATMFCEAVTGIPVAEYGLLTPLPFALAFGVIYSVAVFLGYWYGQSHPKW